MKNILILTDYKGQFWLKTNYKEESVDTILLEEEFSRLGYSVVRKKISEIDFKQDNYNGIYVFYQSSEDPGLYYQSFIEDILLSLKLQGAILIPDFLYFRAHHNKVFMVMLSQIMGTAEMQNIKAWYYGTYEDYISDKRIDRNKKYVFKLSSGAQSKNVRLINNQRDYFHIPLKNSSTFNFYYWLIDQVKPFWKIKYPEYKKKSHHRQKFIIEEFVSNLEGDYKVLVFDKKVFVLDRKIRPNDFRASGSGRFSFIRDIPVRILDFALEVYHCFKVPFISLDIAMKDNKLYLFEFQFVHFGTYTAEKAPFYFIKQGESWQTVDEVVTIETEFAIAIHQHINKLEEL